MLYNSIIISRVGRDGRGAGGIHAVPGDQAARKAGFAYETYLCTIPLDFDRVNLHWHDQMEVIYIKKGRGTVSVNLESYPVEAGCIVPVLPGSCTPSTAPRRAHGV